MDMSRLDKQYFYDKSTYNCPFCNRKHIAYSVAEHARFDWSDDKPCYLMVAQCDYCQKRSLHLSYTKFVGIYEYTNNAYVSLKDHYNLDNHIFFSAPSSFFTIDERIPKKLRELFAEAEGCLKGNFLTGASACARKVVYELAKREKADGEDYTEQLKSLKKKLPHIDADYFDTLIDVKDTTSSKVHENASDAWDSGHVRLILSTLIEVLDEIYVEPEIKKAKRAAIKKLRQETLPPKSPQPQPPTKSDA